MGLLLGSFLLWGLEGYGATETETPKPAAIRPAIQSLIKPPLFRRMVEDREILTSARLDDGHYSYFVAMLVHSNQSQTRRALTDYGLYSRLISYVDRTEYSPITQTLDVQGGIWKFRLRSWVKFEERGESWIHYRIVQGHFTGLEGDIFLEPAEKKGTLVYFRGDQRGTHWPPKFVIERGAEIVFGLTAHRMRNYLERVEGELITRDRSAIDSPTSRNENKDVEHVGKNNGSGKDFPQPRSHL
jgi:hypothetical protein